MESMEPMDAKLDRLLVAYKQAVPDPEVSPQFMPKLWQKIDARRNESLSIFRRLAEVCVMATLALALLMSVLLPQAEPGVAGNYVDALKDEQASEYAVLLEVDDLL